MADALDSLIDEALGGSSGGGSSDMLDQLINDALNPQEPSLGARAVSGVVNTPGMLWDQVTSIPSGVANTYTSLKSLAESLFSGSTQPLIENKETLDKTARGWGGLASGVAGAEIGLGLGTMAAPFTAGISIPLGVAAGGALGLLGFNKANQLTGADEDTTLRQDLGDLVENTTMGLTLAGAAKGAGALAKKAPKLASDLDRKSLQTRASDYGKGSEVKTVDTPEGIPETFVKSTLNNLLEEGKLGSSRDPAKLAQVVDKTSESLSSAVDTLVQNFDESNKLRKIDPPPFQHALEYLESGKVPGDQIESFFNKLIKLDEGIINEGQGKLSFLQEQKKAAGVAYDKGDANLKGFNQAIYRDLKEHVEKYVPEVKSLNQELQKFEIVRPIVNRSLKAAENKDALTKLRDIAYTTGGIGAPTIAGSILGGPAGAVIGAGLGLTGKALASPRGLATTAKVLRVVGKTAPAFEGLFTPSKRGSLKGTQLQDPLAFAISEAEAAADSAGVSLRPSTTKLTAGTSSPVNTETAVGTKSLSNESLKSPPSHKYSPDISEAAILRDSGFISHYYDTIRAYPELQKTMGDWAGDNKIISDIKKIKTAAGKIKRKHNEGKPGYDETNIGDLIRGQIVVKSPSEAMGMLQKIEKSNLIEGPIENYFTHPKPENYRGVHVNVRLPGGDALAEIQIHTPKTLKVQDALHGLFETFRELSPAKQKLYYWDYIETSRRKAAEIELGKEPFFKSNKKQVWETDEQFKALKNKKKEAAASERGSTLRGGSGSAVFGMFNPNIIDKATSAPAIKDLFSKPKKEGATNLKPVNQVEAEIDKNPYYSALYEAESGRNPKAKNPESSASGGFQFINSTAKAMKLDDPFDLEKSFEKVQEMTNQHKVRFGDDPEMLYAAHYLGASVLRKYLEGEDLTKAQEAQVEYFKEKALPRFMRIYQKVKKTNSVEV